MPLVATAPLAIGVSAGWWWPLTPGMVAIAAGLTASLAHGPAQARLFGTMTIGFAVAQATGAYGLSALFATSGSHLPLFAVGAGVARGGAVAGAAAVRMLGAVRGAAETSRPLSP